MTTIWHRIRGTNEPDLSCQELVELVTDYLEGVLSDSDRRRFKNRLSACAGCENYIDQMRETVIVVGRIDADQLPDETKSELLAAFRGWARG